MTYKRRQEITNILWRWRKLRQDSGIARALWRDSDTWDDAQVFLGGGSL